jgi:hypothetical protein
MKIQNFSRNDEKKQKSSSAFFKKNLLSPLSFPLLRDPGVRKALDHVGELPVRDASHLRLFVELRRRHLLVDVLLAGLAHQDLTGGCDFNPLRGRLLGLELASALFGLDEERGGEGGDGGALEVFPVF